MSIFISKTPDPEQQVLAWELNAVLEAAVDTIPEIYRSVFMLREIEEMSTAETAECLDISEEAVKTRLHLARALLREELYARIGIATTGHSNLPARVAIAWYQWYLIGSEYSSTKISIQYHLC